MWTSSERAAHRLAVLQTQVADVQNNAPVEATYEDIIGDLKCRYGDKQLAEASRPQLRARIQLNGESLQGFAAAFELLAHRALVGLPMDFIQRESAHVFKTE
jgi:hypothetical protein